MSNFITKMNHILTSVSKVEKKYEKLIADKDKTLNKGAATGINYNYTTWIICLFSAASLLKN